MPLRRVKCSSSHHQGLCRLGVSGVPAGLKDGIHGVSGDAAGMVGARYVDVAIVTPAPHTPTSSQMANKSFLTEDCHCHES